MKKIYSLFLLLPVSCTSTKQYYSYNLPDDELEEVIQSDNKAKATFEKFCDNDGKQSRDFSLTVIWPLGYCGGSRYQDESDRLHSLFMSSLEENAVTAVNRALVSSFDQRTAINTERKVFIDMGNDEDDDKRTSPINWQCDGVTIPYIVQQEDRLFFYDYSRPGTDNGFYYPTYVEQMMFQQYIVVPNEAEKKKYNKPAYDSSYAQNFKRVSAMEKADRPYNKELYLNKITSVKKTVRGNKAIFTLTYDLNDFCSRAKLKQDLIVR